MTRSCPSSFYMNKTTQLEKVVSLAKRRGFVYGGSEIYGGLANSWDYGPLGTELKNNLREWWWQRFVRSRDDMVGLDPAILMNPRVWEASGHLKSFNDIFVDCRQCRTRQRADHLIEEAVAGLRVEGKTPGELTEIIKEHKLSCPNCGARGTFTRARRFNLLFRTFLGILEDDKSAVYLRGELAQGIFVNFKNVLTTSRARLPFGIAAIGKVFRNEITPRNFIFRTLEFDLMELEYFVFQKEWQKWFDYWLAEQRKWLAELGFSKQSIRVREHTKEELSHYSQRTIDIEYKTPFGWKEMFGLAYRTDYDLKSHAQLSGRDMRYTDPKTKERFFPHVIEPTFGLTRLVLMVMLEAYHEEEVEGAEGRKEKRVVMKLHPRLAPIKAAVFPLLKNDKKLVEKARQIYGQLKQHVQPVFYDEGGSIGRRYRRQDEAGTPFGLTVDHQTLKDETLTLRDRDTMKQERVKIDEAMGIIKTRVED